MDMLRSQIMTLADKGCSSTAIAKRLGIGRDVVCGHRRRASIEAAKAAKQRPTYYARAIELYHQGYMAREIAKDVGKSASAVESAIKNLRAKGLADARRAMVARKQRMLREKPSRQHQPSLYSRNFLGDGIYATDASKRPLLTWEQQDRLYAERGDYGRENVEIRNATIRYLPMPEPNRTLTGSQLA